MTAKLTVSSMTRAVAVFGNRQPVATADFSKKNSTITVSFFPYGKLLPDKFEEYIKALELVGKHAGKVMEKPFRVKGTKVDPDEPTPEEGKDLVVTCNIWPNSFIKVGFTVSPEKQIRFSVPSMKVTSFPDLAQVVYAYRKMAELAKAYTK